LHHHTHENREEREWRFGRRGGFGGFGRGFGPFGPNFGGGRGGRGFGGGAFRVGKMLADGDLRVVVLALIEEGPRHGYDIIKALEERSSGVYSPSPGVVYPTLTYLEEVGYATATSEGNKKVYAITDAGRAHLEENRELATMVLDGIEKFGRKMAQARAWWESGRRGDNAPDRDIPGVIDAVNEARRALKAAIAEKLDASEEEQHRLALILQEAAEKIRKSGPQGGKDKGIDL
jgi:DNA-binding PadR family transcriptional regulator